jgi:hypothetical protein
VIMQKRLLHALFPAVLFLASSGLLSFPRSSPRVLTSKPVLATVADVECAYTLGHPSSAEIRITTMAWLVVNVLLNIMLTTLIVVTLWPARRHGDKRVTSVVGILAESAAGYTVAGVLFIGAVGAGSPFQILFERVFGATAVRTAPYAPASPMLTGTPVPQLEHHHVSDRDGYRIRPAWGEPAPSNHRRPLAEHNRGGHHEDEMRAHVASGAWFAACAADPSFFRRRCIRHTFIFISSTPEVSV